MADTNQPNAPKVRRFIDNTIQNPSRRKFLIGAAVATATAAAATVGTVEAARNGASGIVQPISKFTSSVSQQITSSMCFEDTNYHQVQQFTVDSQGNCASQPGNFFIWFTARKVPAGGPYTITITPSLGNTTKAFKLSSNGNNGFLFVESTGQAADCPTSADPNPASPTKVSHTADGVSPFTLNATHDVQVKVHVDYNGGALKGPTTFTFNGSIISGTTTLSSASVSVVGKQK